MSSIMSPFSPSSRLYSRLSSRSLFTAWMGPTHLVLFLQTLRKHRTTTVCFFFIPIPHHTWCFKVSRKEHHRPRFDEGVLAKPHVKTSRCTYYYVTWAFCSHGCDKYSWGQVDFNDAKILPNDSTISVKFT